MSIPQQTLAPLVGSPNLGRVPVLRNGSALLALLAVLMYVVIIFGHGAGAT